MKVKREKIIEENILYEDEEEDAEGNEEDQFEVEEGEEEEEGDVSVEEDVWEEDEQGQRQLVNFYLPRSKMQAYKQSEGQALKQKKRNPLKFTKGTDPRVKDIMTFLVDDSIACP